MSSIDSVEALADSATAGGTVPAELNGALQALWLTKADQWHEAHNIAQDLDSKMGDWIHGLLHLIEGDIGNSSYWYRRAGQMQPSADGIDTEWRRIAEAALSQ